VVETSGTQYAPNILADYLFELAQKFNHFYKDMYVLTAETVELKKARLVLTEVVANILKDGLAMLGMDTVEKM
jgi:arginyl-tRNA synthetase